MADEPTLQHVLDRLELMDRRFDAIERQMSNGIVHRLDALSGRVDALSGRMDALTGRVDTLAGRVDSMSGLVGEMYAVVIPDAK